MINFTQLQKDKINADYKVSEELAAGRKEELFASLARCSETEEYCFKFLLAYLPMTDLTNWNGELFYNHVHTCVEVFEKTPWKDEVDTETFLNFVLMIRVNNENLEYYNQIIYDELKERISGMTLEEAAVEVNLWCFEKATYSSTDMRTVSPLTMMRNTNGRCGEESTFLTAALRSCGIPSRQCYTPRWAAGDSNHAWVEVYCKGDWKYIGACEPEPFLNSGWFRMPASRAMLTNTRVFSDFMPKNARYVSTSKRIIELNTLDIYAETRDIYCLVTENGTPKAGVRVRMSLINSGMLFDFSDSITDENGKTYFTTGYGDLFITATLDDKIMYGKIDVRESDHISLDWTNATCFDGLPEEFDFDLIPPQQKMLPPIERPSNAEEFAKAFREKQKISDKIRTDYKSTFYSEESNPYLCEKYPAFAADIKQFLIDSQGNAKKIEAFIDDEKNIADKISFLKGLSRKDFGDCDNIILEKQFAHQIKYAEKFADDRLTFERFVLAIRISNEWLSAYSLPICEYFSDDEKADFINSPHKIHEYVENNILDSKGYDYETLVAMPYNLLKTKRGSAASKAVLEVAICRSLGIPARTMFGAGVEYFKDGDWFNMQGVSLKEERSAKIIPTVTGVEEAGRGLIIEKYEDGMFRPVPIFRRRRRGDRSEEPEHNEFAIVPGNYRALTNFRLKNGGIQAKMYHFTVKEGQTLEKEFKVRPEKSDDETSNLTIFDAEITDKDGNAKKLSELSKGKTVFAWLGVKEEPTEHLFNEMLSVTEGYKKYAKDIYFIVKSEEELSHITLKKLLERLPQINIYYFKKVDEKVYASLKTNDTRYPLAVVLDENLNVKALSTGYNIGSAEMILKALGK